MPDHVGHIKVYATPGTQFAPGDAAQPRLRSHARRQRGVATPPRQPPGRPLPATALPELRVIRPRRRFPAGRRRQGDGVELLGALALGDSRVVADGADGAGVAGGRDVGGAGAGAGGLEDGQDAGGGGDQLGEGIAQAFEVDVLELELGGAEGQALASAD
jgi:hypothetical protein